MPRDLPVMKDRQHISTAGPGAFDLEDGTLAFFGIG